MRQKISIPENEIERLKKSGWSNQRLSQKFKVSISTIKRRLKTPEPKDKKVMCFAAELERFSAVAPNDYCRKEILRAVNVIRNRHSVSKDEKKNRVLESIRTGARTVEEIADDFGYKYEAGKFRSYSIFKIELETILEEMIAENAIEKRAPGGMANRGRKIKFQYFLMSN